MLRKMLILCLVSLAISISAYGFSEDNISAIEYAKYGINYPDESLGERLNRLETDYFGMSQTGNIEDRLAKLSKINKNRQNGVNLAKEENYYKTRQKGVFRNFWSNLTSGISNNGYITGYTPSMNTIERYGSNIYDNNAFCPYNPNYRNTLKPHGYYNKKYLNNDFNGVNRFTPYTRRHLPYNANYYGNNPAHRLSNRPYYTNHSAYYSPPNMETKSSIHILKD